MSDRSEYPLVVKIIVDDDGKKVDSPKWCYIEDHSDAERTLCSGEVFGYGESTCEYIKKHGKITCVRCIEIIKRHKSVKL